MSCFSSCRSCSFPVVPRHSFTLPVFSIAVTSFLIKIARMLRGILLVLCGLGWMTGAGVCWAQVDEFDDDNDAGWTHVDPIGMILGSPFASYTVQSGLYRLRCEPTPDAELGPARLSTYRPEQSYGDFLVVVDVVSFDSSLDQAFGILARLQPNPGPGAVSGYSLNYQPNDSDIEINRIEDEQPVNLARVPVNLAPGEAYRFVFEGRGDQLTAAVFALAEPLKPLVTLSAGDDAWESGPCGLFAFDTAGAGAVDVVFDSYAAGTPAVPELRAVGVGPAVQLEWPRLTGNWHLERSENLILWEDVVLGGAVSQGKLVLAAPGAGKGFYRMVSGWAVAGE